MMKHKPTWWKLYLFAALGCAGLFLLSSANHTTLIIWMLVIYGGIGYWLMSNQQHGIETVDYHPTVITPPVAEFFDEDRIQLQQNSTEIPDDNWKDSSHEAV